MAASFLAINRTSSKGGALGSLLDQGKLNSAQFVLHWNAMQTMVDDPASPTNFTILEQQYGITAGGGAQLYAAIKQTVVDFNASQGLAALTQIG